MVNILSAGWIQLHLVESFGSGSWQMTSPWIVSIFNSFRIKKLKIKQKLYTNILLRYQLQHKKFNQIWTRNWRGINYKSNTRAWKEASLYWKDKRLGLENGRSIDTTWFMQLRYPISVRSKRITQPDLEITSNHFIVITLICGLKFQFTGSYNPEKIGTLIAQ